MVATPASTPAPWADPVTTGLIVLADGRVLEGTGVGAIGHAVGEICFNTAITGYQEILTDPSYTAQIVTFTFPHIGNVGANAEDIETANSAADAGVRGAILRQDITAQSSWRAESEFPDWLARRGIVGVAGIDTRALTAMIRESGMPNAVIAHSPDGQFDIEALKAEAAAWPGLEGMDLVPDVATRQRYSWDGTPWDIENGHGTLENPEHHVVAIDYGVKRNILRQLADEGCKVTVVPPTSSFDDIMALKPDGIFLSNGPGDPAATGEYSVSVIKQAVESGLPVFGICLGHQMMALALGGQTHKMLQGHHGANHPVMDHTTGKVEITSMNHGFAVDTGSLPDTVEETHVSLFDNTNCGLRLKGEPVFSVQYHPEASPGPQDSHYLFTRFVNLIRAQKGQTQQPEGKKAMAALEQ
jgi:carbamoyl-phosphate synthase small subunit